LANDFVDHGGTSESRVLIFATRESEILAKDSRIVASKFIDAVAIARDRVGKVMLSAESPMARDGIDLAKKRARCWDSVWVYRDSIGLA
jgi:hypothetical protein